MMFVEDQLTERLKQELGISNQRFYSEAGKVGQLSKPETIQSSTNDEQMKDSQGEQSRSKLTLPSKIAGPLNKKTGPLNKRAADSRTNNSGGQNPDQVSSSMQDICFGEQSKEDKNNS